jgi:hypothetical protein
MENVFINMSIIFYSKIVLLPHTNRGSLPFQKIYGLGKVILKIKWPGRLEKTQI